MKVIIHKGSQEIGGNCIQISSGKTTILLDAGLPLSADSQPVDLSRLIVDALLISHPHQDHFGLMATLPPGTPVYIGRLARSLIDATQVFLGRDRYALDFHDIKAWQPFTIGEFTITPYLVDHSATDAYAFLIEAEGNRLFYSGDLRSHGRKGMGHLDDRRSPINSRLRLNACVQPVVFHRLRVIALPAHIHSILTWCATSVRQRRFFRLPRIERIWLLTRWSRRGSVRRVDKSLINGAEEGDFEVVNNLQSADHLIAAFEYRHRRSPIFSEGLSNCGPTDAIGETWPYFMLREVTYQLGTLLQPKKISDPLGGCRTERRVHSRYGTCCCHGWHRRMSLCPQTTSLSRSH